MRPQLSQFVRQHAHQAPHIWRCVGLRTFLLALLSIGIMASATLADSVVRFELNFPGNGTIGSFDVELFDNAAPITVANFLRYINDGLYDNTVFHRNVKDFVVQGGGFAPTIVGGSVTGMQPITNYGTIQNEFSSTRSNLFGTLAMAKTDAGPNTATNQWFVNMGDNSANLDIQNGGFTVFGKVLGDGMTLIKSINNLTTYNLSSTLGSTFNEVPKFNSGADMVTITSATIVPPTGKLSGTLYYDMDHNGLMNGNDLAMAGVKVSLMEAGSDTPVATVLTASDGSYHFNNVELGTFSIKTEASGQTNLDTGSQQIVLDKDGTIIRTGAAGTGTQDTVSNIALGIGQTALNLNVAMAKLPTRLISARMLLNSRKGYSHVNGVPLPGTNASTDSVLSFGNVLVGASGSTSLTVTNIGGAGSTLSGSFPSASGLFGTAGTATFGPLNAGQPASHEYTFSPITRGSNSQDITVGTTVGNLKVTLSGRGVAPISSLAQADNGYALVGSTNTVSVKVKNTGDGNLSNLGAISNLNGTISALSGSISGPGGTVSLGDGLTDTYGFVYTPTMKGGTTSVPVSASFDNGNPDGTNTAHSPTITLTSIGVAPVSSITQHDAGHVLVGNSGTASVTIQNTGNGNLSGLGEISNLNGTISAASGTVTGAAGTFSGPGDSLSLLDGTSRIVNYTFTPKERGTTSSVITSDFSNGSTDGTNTAHSSDITLSGIGVAPVSSLTQSDTGYSLVGHTNSMRLKVKNTGDGNLSDLGAISNLNGTVSAVSGSFSGLGGTVSLTDGASSQSFDYVFTPTTKGGTSSFDVSANFANGSQDGTNSAHTSNITLSSIGVAPVSFVAHTDTGYALVGNTNSISVKVTNTGDGNKSGLGEISNLTGSISTVAGSFSGAGGSISLGDGLSQTFNFTYNPTVRGETGSGTISAIFSNGSADGTNSSHSQDIVMSRIAVAPVSSLAHNSDAGYVLVNNTASTGNASIMIQNVGNGNLSGLGAISNLFGMLPETSGNFSGTVSVCDLGDGESEIINYNFKPTKRGIESTDIDVDFLNGNPDGTNTQHTSTATISGTGVAPVSSITTHDAGYVLVNNTASSGTASIIVQNIGNGNLSGLGEISNLNGTISAATGTASGAAGTFAGTGGSLSLLDGTSQIINYTYKAKAKGTSTLVIASSFSNGSPDETNSAHSPAITITGTGVAPVWSLNQSDTRYALVGGSGTMTLTITNSGNGNLSGLGAISNLSGSISGFSGSISGVAGTFSGPSDKTVNLGDGLSKTFDYTYLPTVKGGTCSVTISTDFANGSTDGTNSAGKPTFTLSSTAVAPVSSITQGGSIFSLVGIANAVNVTVTNSGNGNLSGLGAISNLNGTVSAVSGDFSGLGGSLSLGDGLSKTFDYTYTPALKGATGSVTISADFANGKADGTNGSHLRDIVVSSTGVAPLSSLSQSGGGYALVGSTGTVSLKVQNTGNGNLSGLGDISNLRGTVAAVSGGFSGPGGSLSLGDSASKTFDYTFSPTVKGGTSSIDVSASFFNGSSNGTNSSHNGSFALVGTGVAPVSSLTYVNAGYTLVNSTGTASITINNAGNGNLSGLGAISNLNGTLSGGSEVFSGPGGALSLADNASKTFNYTYKPTVKGATGSVTVSASFANGKTDGTNTAHAQDITFSGVGVAPVQSVGTATANAGLVRVGTTGTASITINNQGNGNLSGLGDASNLNGFIASGAGRFVGPGGHFSLPDAAIQSFDFIYAPTTRTADSMTTTVKFDNGSADGKNLAETVNAQLTGQGVGPVFSSDLAPGSTLTFGTISQSDMVSQFLTISNMSTDLNGGDSTLTDLTILSASITGADAALFSIENFTPGSVLNEGGSMSLKIAYNGTGSPVERFGTLTILTDEGAAFGVAGHSFIYQIGATLTPDTITPPITPPTTPAAAVCVASPVPEPSSLVLLAIAGLLLGCLTRRRCTSRRD